MNRWSPISFFNSIHSDPEKNDILKDFTSQVSKELKNKTKHPGRVVFAVIESKDELVVKQIGINAIYLVNPVEEVKKFDFDLALNDIDLYNQKLLTGIMAVDGPTGPQTYQSKESKEKGKNVRRPKP